MNAISRAMKGGADKATARQFTSPCSGGSCAYQPSSSSKRIVNGAAKPPSSSSQAFSVATANSSTEIHTSHGK